MINAVYLQKPGAPDLLIGRVDGDGKVYAVDAQLMGKEPDKYMGRVNLENGKIYDASLVPEKYIGRVDLRNGKVYQSKFGPDEYLGQVDDRGRMFYHLPLKRDPYLGKVEKMTALAHGGAAYLLLIMPKLDEMEA
jgi:hypothetical protein